MSAEENGSDEHGRSSGGRTAIGISFGNSYSSIAYTTLVEGKAEVIANEEGDRQIPSTLSYVVGEEYHGTQAKSQMVRNPRNTVAYFRDFLGKPFSAIDPTPCHTSAHPISHDGGTTVAFKVQQTPPAEDKESEQEPAWTTVSVSEVTTRHLRRLKQSATDFLGKEVDAAVVTVPSDFTDGQKAALTAAAAAAGIEILQFIPESISSLLAYDAKLQQAGEAQRSHQDKVVVVADLGGIRSDVTIVASRGGMYTTLAAVHDFEVGGAALDNVLMEYAAKEFLKKHKTAKDPRQNERSAAKLKLEAEAVKRALSLGASATFSVESLSDGLDFTLTVNRTRFELLANKALMSLTRLIESAAQKADLDVLDIDEILLSGGTSHIPKIASNLQAHFPETTVIISPSTSPSAVNPSELAARGAAIQANLIAGFEKADIEENVEPVVTVTPHLPYAIGMVTGNDAFSVIIPPESPIPVRRVAQVSVAQGGDVLVRIAEGVREIKVTRDDKPTTNGGPKDGDDDEEDTEDDDDEPEETRSILWKPGKLLAEAAMRNIKKKGKVEVQINVAADLSVTTVIREVGGKGGVRGVLEAGQIHENGSAA